MATVLPQDSISVQSFVSMAKGTAYDESTAEGRKQVVRGANKIELQVVIQTLQWATGCRRGVDLSKGGHSGGCLTGLGAWLDP